MFVLLKLVAIYEGPPDAHSFFAARTVQAFLLRTFLYLMYALGWSDACDVNIKEGLSIFQILCLN